MAFTPPVTAAVVYPRGARLRRVGALELAVGPQRVTISGLEAALDPASVRVSARGTAQARLGGVETQRRVLDPPRQEEVERLRQTLATVDDDLARLARRKELIAAEGERLQELAAQTPTYALALAAGERTLAAHLALLAELRARQNELADEILALGAAERQLQRQQAELQAALNEWSRGRSADLFPWEVTLDLEVVQAGALTVTLTYQVDTGGWRPLYDLRLGADGVLTVTYLAEVRQQSGQDWQAVALSLSTARPESAAALPELTPRYVQPQPPAQPVRMAKLAAAEMDFARAAPAPAPEYDLTAAAAQVESGGAAVVYVIPGQPDIPGDGGPRKLTVATFDLRPDLDFVAAPEISRGVHRRAQVVNATAYTWLPGPAALFAGDEFIGSIPLDLILPEQAVELFLGVDDSLRVERKLARREVDKRLLGNRRRITFAYTVEAQNLGAAAAALEVRERIPVSRHEEIKVRLERAEPPPSEQTELNLLTWRLELAPGASQMLRYDFSVEAPVGMEVWGLP
jgi:uncharacterized protein (TIGR02231 family)